MSTIGDAVENEEPFSLPTAAEPSTSSQAKLHALSTVTHPSIAGSPSESSTDRERLSTELTDVAWSGLPVGDVAVPVAYSRLLPLKRVVDVLLVLLSAVLVVPLLGFMAVLIKLLSPGPVFYGHWRLGRDGREFRAWKLRTMILDADQVLHDHLERHPADRAEWEQVHKLRLDPRILPRIGWLLRVYSLDELPQLWNVLRGEMSLVGPRPIVTEEVPRYGDEILLYVQVRPGITGLWQVSGRNNIAYADRVRLDATYVRNWSPWLDLMILLRTPAVVLRRTGAY